MKTYRKNNVNNFVSVCSFRSLYYFRFSSDRGIGPKDCHDFPEMQYVDDGDLEIIVDGVTHNLKKGDLIIFAPNAVHYSLRPQDANIAIVSFDVDSESLAPLYNKVITLNSYQRELLSKIISSGVELFEPLSPDEDYKGIKPSVSLENVGFQLMKNRLELLLIDLYTSLGGDPEKPCNSNTKNYKDTLCDQIVDFMRNNVSSPITNAEICNRFQISTSTLKKIFKETFNLPPKAYYTELKIKEAKRMIRDTALNFTEISTKLGFDTIHHFSKTFKEKTGSTPSEYAKSIYKR